MDSPFEQIQHFVVLMLENRSFDHLLGFLYKENNNTSPLGHPFDGLTGSESNPDSSGNAVGVFPIQSSDPYCYFYPKADPGEGYLNTNSQLFGSPQAPAAGTQAGNTGFVTNFDYTLGWQAKEGRSIYPGTQASDIMGVYLPEQLPILSGLAKAYAVSDAWFGSAPTETLPNRAFALMATSQGRLSDQDKVYTAPSIFTALAQAGNSWAVYGYDAPALCRHSVADITSADEAHFGVFADFKQAAASGQLANFIFLEPSWGSDGNSQHPNYDVSKAEALIAEVYDTLLQSPAWNQTLLIVTYDEHGGCYDHVAPPTNAVAPDDSQGQYGFDFTRFGPRVPTLLISPWIEAGTVFRSATATPFDHTSVLATVEKRFGLAPLTRRDAAAPTFEAVFSLQAPRTDQPLAGVTPPVNNQPAQSDSQPSHLQHALAHMVSDLPVPDAQGNGSHHSMPDFGSADALMSYVRERHGQYVNSLQQS